MSSQLMLIMRPPSGARPFRDLRMYMAGPPQASKGDAREISGGIPRQAHALGASVQLPFRHLDRSGLVFVAMLLLIQPTLCSKTSY